MKVIIFRLAERLMLKSKNFVISQKSVSFKKAFKIPKRIRAKKFLILFAVVQL